MEATYGHAVEMREESSGADTALPLPAPWLRAKGLGDRVVGGLKDCDRLIGGHRLQGLLQGERPVGMNDVG